MCIGTPKVTPATQYQAAKAPVRREATSERKTGRRGTILTGSSAQGEVTAGGKKTALGT